jgi:hypothetical protein
MAHPPASSKEKTMPDRPRAVSSNTAPAAMLHVGNPGAQEEGGNQQTSKLPGGAVDEHCSLWARVHGYEGACAWVHGYEGARVHRCAGRGPGREQV